MNTWRTMDGHTYQEVKRATFATELEARRAAEALGATLTKERMQGAFYRTPDGRAFRIASLGWASGFVLWESVRKS